MVIAADYPFLDILWTMLIFFAWVIWFVLLIRIFGDIFRRRDISGWGKAGWMFFVVILPFLGVFIYLIANGTEMGERDLEQSKASRAEFDDYVRNVATQQGSGGAAGPAAEIAKAKELLDSGAIDQAEFDRLKAQAIG